MRCRESCLEARLLAWIHLPRQVKQGNHVPDKIVVVAVGDEPDEGLVELGDCIGVKCWRGDKRAWRTTPLAAIEAGKTSRTQGRSALLMVGVGRAGGQRPLGTLVHRGARHLVCGGIRRSSRALLVRQGKSCVRGAVWIGSRSWEGVPSPSEYDAPQQP